MEDLLLEVMRGKRKLDDHIESIVEYSVTDVIKRIATAHGLDARVLLKKYAPRKPAAVEVCTKTLSRGGRCSRVAVAGSFCSHHAPKAVVLAVPSLAQNAEVRAMTRLIDQLNAGKPAGKSDTLNAFPVRAS